MPRKGLGQHFLHDPAILAAIASQAHLEPTDSVLEVGTGPGTLTHHLAAVAGKVLTVDVDPRMIQFAAGELAGRANVRFLHADVLDGRSQLSSRLVDELRALGPYKLVANLPYSIATPLLMALLASPIAPELAVVTIQRELAARLRSPPGTRSYGPVTAIFAHWATLERVRGLPAGAFWPPPTVESEVVRILPRKAPLGQVEDYCAYRFWVHRLLSRRRKQLGGLLREILGDARAREAADLLGLCPTARPDAISPPGFVLLSRKYESFKIDSAHDLH